ncbi:winged helix-turn-helix domain-containing protein [Streptacidiphilus sp. N1-10]|uniref:Winged helix-turn-helix domain-containing protein n=1 Tax=Streptacidiphilus jeojiensis TaxID=3229225 RepID=A0ABV6XVM2_9ACTN
MSPDESPPEPRGPLFKVIVDYLQGEITSGGLARGEKAPSQHELMAQFGVVRSTVQRAMEELKREGWLDAVQGSGTFVKGIPSADGSAGARMPTSAVLSDWLKQAFRESRVELDVLSFTSESFHLALAEALMPIRVNRSGPKSIRVRMLLPADGPTLAYPRRVDGLPDERLRLRSARLIERQAGNVDEALVNLHAWGYVDEVDVDIRRVPVMPLQKIYLLNRTESLRGNYEIAKRRLRLDTGEFLEVYDVLGLGAQLDLFTSGSGRVSAESSEVPEEAGTRIVRQDQRLFDSLWESADGIAEG